MPNSGFWSYVHADDDVELGRITQLAKDLAGQYAAMTAEPIELIVDKVTLGWGDDWETQLNDAIVSTAFFVPVVSPRYLASEACRRELQLFARRAERLGYHDLILSLLYFDVPEFDDPTPTDDLVALIKRYQLVDWRELRFEDRTSGAYRRAVADLARRLVEVNARLSVQPPAEVSLSAPASEDRGDAPGSLDLLAAFESALPQWSSTVTAVGAEIDAVSALAAAATEDIHRGDSAGKGFAARLTVARGLSRDLEPHAQRIEELGNEFTTQLYEVDGGVRAILAQLPREVQSDETSRSKACEFLESIRSMAASSRGGLGSMRGLIDSIEPIESMSRDLRVPLQKLRKGLTVMVEGQAVIDEWDRAAAEQSLECGDTGAVTGD